MWLSVVLFSISQPTISNELIEIFSYLVGIITCITVSYICSDSMYMITILTHVSIGLFLLDDAVGACVKLPKY